jgi:hypothetical protein
MQGESVARGPGIAADRSSRLAVAALAVLAALFLVWPLWRAQLPLEIWGNEGWNAYNTDAAFGRLYPPPDGLTANNYPPLSFYLIGALARVFGDALYVGRVLSLLATLGLGVFAAAVARQLGAGRAAAALAGLWFVATMARFFDFYVGMNEPQLLAHAVMAAGFCWFLARWQAKRAVEPAVLVMVLAGFFKHNIVVLPVVALVWLALHDRRMALRAGLVGAGTAAAGLAICAIAYGGDFVADMLLPRTYHLDRALLATGRLQFVAPALIIWAIWAWRERHSSAARFTALLVGVGLAAYLLQKAGAGVDENAQFDLVFAAAVGVGLAFDRLPALATRRSPRTVRLILLGVLALRLIASTRMEFAYVLLSPDYRAQAAEHAAIARAEAARIAALPSPVACSNPVVCRMAGKPFVYDPFKIEMMRNTGAMSETAIQAALRRQGVVFVAVDPRANATSLYRRVRTD